MHDDDLKDMIYEGKAKKIFKSENSDEVKIYYKDDATAFNNLKKSSLKNKGEINATITTCIYKYLEKNGIKTHFIKVLEARLQLCKKVKIIPLEVIVRNIIAGSLAKRLDIKEGTKAKSTIFEICYKNDDLGDPLINDSHALALGLANKEDLEQIYSMACRINNLLKEFFEKCDIELIDFKLEFGKDKDLNIILADEISPDSCRLWDKKTQKKLDKDRFREDLGEVIKAYEEVLLRIKKAGLLC